ncbi:MAG: methylated-DNA--[protein]-cysteine S-methyltransferase [Ramlibacter sp.]|nr:methylated-DNA--[protein]-cysteine S-methyltransferase [Ramlibacter sp.]
MAHASGFCLFGTAIGSCGIAWNERGEIAGAQLPESGERDTRGRMRRRFPGVPEAKPSLEVEAVVARVRALLDGVRDPLLDVRLDLDGVPEFKRRVYEITRAIAPGRTLTYGELAARLGEPGAARAVGQALGHNPFAPIVPCHRVLAAGTGAGGFSAEGGVATKLRMLQIEQAQFGPQPGLFDEEPKVDLPAKSLRIFKP